MWVGSAEVSSTNVHISKWDVSSAMVLITLMFNIFFLDVVIGYTQECALFYCGNRFLIEH